MSLLSCEPCEQVFNSEDEKQLHLRTALHLRNAQRFHSRNLQIFVTGFGPAAKINDLRSHFQQYGFVNNVYIDKRKSAFAFVEFSKESEVKHALTFPHVLRGRRLVVKKSMIISPKLKQLSASVPVSELVPALSQCSKVGEQIKMFCTKLSLSSEDIEGRHTACAEIESVFKKYYPNCKVHIFGSTTNGFGFKGCDVDLLFEPFPDYWNLTSFSSMNVKKSVSVMDVEQGLVSSADLSHLSANNQVLFLAKVLKRHTSMFLRPIHIPARCPIVKFTYKKFSLQCDISCSSRLVLLNTQLLQFYSKLDERVTPLLMLLRYWGKLRDLIRVGCLSSYAFSMLILFFLQTREPCVIPPVTTLKALAADDGKREENGYECAFCTDTKKIASSRNKETLEELLLGFFKFYANFDFAYVISTLMAEKLDRSTFEEVEGDEEHCFKSSPIAIQDPLEYDRNVTAFAKVKTLLHLKDMMKLAALSLSSNIATDASNPSFGILSILKEVKRKQLPLCIVPNVDLLKPPNNGLMFTVMFSEDYKDCLSDIDNTEGAWMSKISTTLMSMFEEGLGFEAEVVDKYDQILLHPIKDRKRRADPEDTSSSPAKKQCVERDTNGRPEPTTACPDVQPKAIEGPGYIPDAMPPQLLISVQNTVEYNVWTRRRKMKDSHTDLQLQYGKGQSMELEHALTSLLLEDGTAKLSKMIFFTCDCYMYREQACDRLIFCLRPFESFSDFRSLAYFLKGFITEQLNDALLNEKN